MWTDKYYTNSKAPESEVKEYDFFISHASEDKNYAEQLSKKLIEAGKTVWLDASELFIGDSLRMKIDEGLKRSKFGVVLLSEFYFKKFWTNQELSGLVAKEVNGHKIILPIWHKITRDDVLNYSQDASLITDHASLVSPFQAPTTRRYNPRSTSRQR